MTGINCFDTSALVSFFSSCPLPNSFPLDVVRDAVNCGKKKIGATRTIFHPGKRGTYAPRDETSRFSPLFGPPCESAHSSAINNQLFTRVCPQTLFNVSYSTRRSKDPTVTDGRRHRVHIRVEKRPEYREGA